MAAERCGTNQASLPASFVRERITCFSMQSFANSPDAQCPRRVRIIRRSSALRKDAGIRNWGASARGNEMARKGEIRQPKCAITQCAGHWTIASRQAFAESRAIGGRRSHSAAQLHRSCKNCWLEPKSTASLKATPTRANSSTDRSATSASRGTCD